MTNKTTQMNLQDLFLNQVRKENVPVTIYLTGGVQLKGMVRGFDSFTVVLETPGKPPQLIYKHAIASVVPMRSITTRDMAAERERAAGEAPDAARTEPRPPAEPRPPTEPLPATEPRPTVAAAAAAGPGEGREE